MSITDELRKFANDWDWVGCTASVSARKLLTIADRIDAEHEKAVQKEFIRVYTTEADMEHDGWVRLPKDANGEYIHIGDELDGYGCSDGGSYCKAIVNEVMILVGTKDSSYTTWVMWDSKAVRHHHEPTVEDVLSEFAIACEDVGNAGPEVSELIAEYAAKLQLRGDGE